MLTLSSLVLVSTSSLFALAAVIPPQPSSVPSTLTLAHTAHSKRVGPDGTVRGWLDKEKRKTKRKYARSSRGSSNEKRNGFTTIQDYAIDTAYSASISVGTPAKDFDVMLDTGSSDLFLVGDTCSSCSGLTTWDPSSSTTYKNLTTAFEITYGSGSAEGYLVTDDITLAGLEQKTQTFAVVTEIASDFIEYPLSGIMGMAFKSLSSSGATPWWQSQASSWTSKVFAFQLARYRNVTDATSYEEQGGYLDLGALNSSHYSGDVNYITCSAETYWQIPVSGLTVQGTKINMTSTTSSSSGTVSTLQAAIDTGTTLITVPTDTAAYVYAAIDGAKALTESGYEGYYEFPCDTDVNVTLTFGKITYSIDSVDFNIGQMTTGSSMCLGGISGSDLDSSINWIVGDTFLKNVYSVYSYSGSTTGSKVGFANISDDSMIITEYMLTSGATPKRQVTVLSALVGSLALTAFSLL